MLVIIMIETKEAVTNIEEIAKVPGIDLWHIGPYDLSLSMGVPRDSPELATALNHVEEVARTHHIPLGGYAPTLAQAHAMEARGYRFFTIPGDMELLQHGVRDFFDSNH